MHRLALSAALCLAALPALAQDRGAQFAQAARAFTLPGVASLGHADVIEDDAIMALLPGLEGDWVTGNVLFPDPASFTPGLLESACGDTKSTLVQTAPRSFEMRRTRERPEGPVTLTVRFDYVLGNTFDRGVAEGDVVAYMDLASREEIPSGMLAMPHLRGQVQVFHPSPDILVLTAATLAPEFWVRCP